MKFLFPFKNLPKKLVVLLVVFVVNCALISVTIFTKTMSTTAQSPQPPKQYESQAPLFVFRVVIKTTSEANRLVNTGLDVLEAREGDALFVLGDEAVRQQLLALGFEVSVQDALGSRAPDTYYNGYRTVVEHYQHLDTVVASYPALAKVIDYGDSWKKVNGLGGNDLKVICLTKLRTGDCARTLSADKPRFFLMAAIHARELSTAETAWRYIDLLTQGYNVDPDITQLLDNNEIWVVPVVNPDGRLIVESGGNSPYLQRKNANNSAAGSNSCANPPSASSQFGVDLNRNSSFGWGGAGTSSVVCDQTYKGTAPASEPEVYFLQDLVDDVLADTKGANRNDAAANTTNGVFITLHSYSNFVILPYGDATANGFAPNDAGLRSLAFRFSYFNNYVTGTGDQILYSTTGTSDDWVYGTLGVPAYTFELGPSSGACSGFTPAYSCQDGTFWPQNKNALLYAAKSARLPYQTALGPTAASLSLSASTTSAGNNVTLSAAIDDGRYGNAAGSYGRPAIQTIAEAEVYVDTPPWAAGATPVAMSAQDGSFNAASENAQVILNTAALITGRHTLYVRGKDSAGNWGPVTAIWLTITPASATSTPAPTLAPTATPLPTAAPTNTPAPTATPSPTAAPTNTPLPTATSVNSNVKINFQPSGAEVPAGYLLDGGNVFANRNNGYSYGWSSSNTANTRDRNSVRSPDQRFDTFAYMQLNAARNWEIAVPNGNYNVLIVAGDANNTNSVFRINAEGTLALSGTPTTASRWLTGTATVTVNDGRLTISNGAGSSNNKICFIEITPSTAKGVNQSSQSMSTVLNATRQNNGVRIDWLVDATVSDANKFVSYQVFRSANADRSESEWVTTLLTTRRNANAAELEYSFLDIEAASVDSVTYWLVGNTINDEQIELGSVYESQAETARTVFVPFVLR